VGGLIPAHHDFSINHGSWRSLSSWQPYAEMIHLHIILVFIALWLCSVDHPLGYAKAVLWAGQLLNILSVIVLYPLAVKVGQNRWSELWLSRWRGFFHLCQCIMQTGKVHTISRAGYLPVVVWILGTSLFPILLMQGKNFKEKYRLKQSRHGRPGSHSLPVLILALIFLQPCGSFLLAVRRSGKCS